MTKTIVACVVLMCAGQSFALSAAPAHERNVVQLGSSATMDVPQDWLSVTLGSTREGTDPVAVQAQLRLALESALADAKKSVQPGAMSVHTGQFSLHPRYARDGKISGWQGTAELVLEGKDFARIGTTVAKVQTMSISSTGFSLSQEGRAKVETQVQAMAIERFKTKAGEIARGFGFGAYELKEVAVNTMDQGQGPRPRMMTMAAKSLASDAPVPMEAGDTTVMVTVTGSVQLK